ncbi:MAG: aspartate/glutamate racemase family protein [Labrenzia sp.]|uniref:Hydantoin racemase n=1 Tax=Roseibium alexandrii (strain DSM 17067 / NCIMB 14079 / DFL-11) TaxID=244592 RepID=A0A5E8GVV3_ROSAD|nr:aspartate/glutamate racemase family protein [Roseibium alexandrii]EEE44087.1 Hydantoin racemase [Roseibium alexandrii DFL-11]
MTIYVINPNSSEHVTDGIDDAIAPMREVSPVPISCLTLKEGPPGIETQAHVDGVVGPLLELAGSLQGDASAFVVACFSDPGLAALREAHSVPVLGIAESAYLQAMMLGQRFGILSLGRTSIQRHIRYLGVLGIRDRLAADLPLGLGVLDLADADRTIARLAEVGGTLRDQFGADVLITGCAGMAQYRTLLEEKTGLPVVDPCQAATAAAIGQLALRTCA